MSDGGGSSIMTELQLLDRNIFQFGLLLLIFSASKKSQGNERERERESPAISDDELEWSCWVAIT